MCATISGVPGRIVWCMCVCVCVVYTKEQSIIIIIIIIGRKPRSLSARHAFIVDNIYLFVLIQRCCKQ